MESSADEIGALCETVVFLGYFRDLPDARQSGKVKYPLDEILLLCLLAVVAGAEAIPDIARFGRVKLALLRRFRPFEDGTPAHDHLGDIFATDVLGARAAGCRHALIDPFGHYEGLHADVVRVQGVVPVADALTTARAA